MNALYLWSLWGIILTCSVSFLYNFWNANVTASLLSIAGMYIILLGYMYVDGAIGGEND